MYQISKQELAQFVKINPAVSTTIQTVGESALSKALEVCKINPITRLEQGALLDLKTMAQKIAVLESNPQWIKLATDSQLGCMTPQSINKAYAQVQQTAISGNTLTQAVPLPQTATAAAAVQPKMAGAMQQTAHSTSPQSAQPKGPTTNNQVAEQTGPTTQQQVTKKTNPGINPNQGQSTNIKGWHRDTYAEEGAWGHVFSKKHIRNGILNLGKDKQEIFAKFIKEIHAVDKARHLVEGDNEIRMLMNGYQLTIRPYMENGIVSSFTAFIGYSGKIKGNLIQW